MRLNFKPRSELGVRREPLFTFDEVADRLRSTPARLKALLRHHPTLKAESRAGSSVSASPRRNLYRMSAAKAWWASLPAHLKETQ